MALFSSVFYFQLWIDSIYYFPSDGKRNGSKVVIYWFCVILNLILKIWLCNNCYDGSCALFRHTIELLRQLFLSLSHIHYSMSMRILDSMNRASVRKSVIRWLRRSMMIGCIVSITNLYSIFWFLHFFSRFLVFDFFLLAWFLGLKVNDQASLWFTPDILYDLNILFIHQLP